MFEPGTVLRMNLNRALAETRPTDLIASITLGNQPTVTDVVMGLHSAANDPNITTLVAYMTNTDIPLTQVQEIREAVRAFRKAGKKTIFYAPTFGELGGGMALYYLAAAFEEIRMQPSGELGLSGISVETPYFKKALQKLGIKPSFQARYEYKTGADSFNAEKMSAPERRNLTQILHSFLDVIAEDIGADRGIDPAAMKDILKNGPYFADQALEMNLIDKIEYADALEKELKEASKNKELNLVDLFEYAAATEPEVKAKTPLIAYVPAVGIIQFGESIFAGDAYRSILGSSSFSGMLREAADNDDVKAIVIRLDSPGGGYTPSDAIRREIEHVRKHTQKPIICSMGATAASGGYFISLGCDKVLADPATLTGSIGVFGGKLVFKDLLEKLDITVSSIKMGKNAGMFSMTQDFTTEQNLFFNDALNRIYQDFTAKVAARRGFSTGKTNSVARGRVFTGAQAVENGLIDQIGGVYASFNAAAEMAEVPKPFLVVEFPTRPSRLEMLVSLLNSDIAVSLRKSILNYGLLPSVKSWLGRLAEGDFRLFYNGIEAF
ncbi:MAG: signal peptide peptidase SppA [Alphaproteobacteria bacterium]|nr:signal peptide peptidase SppA [Alphaproteobacteria bacterium]